ncbi:hypothetical protein EVAR_69538_1 [Eumeta japonica]|uniref:Uncharacterized protein n=1 Tax=Eumeta variegata TaxID=151549 RepID=A0A4C2A725_EUMVA|nr:hypothetical protein EVAR_69538_1 [Eumeta japonica]
MQESRASEGSSEYRTPTKAGEAATDAPAPDAGAERAPLLRRRRRRTIPKIILAHRKLRGEVYSSARTIKAYRHNGPGARVTRDRAAADSGVSRSFNKQGERRVDARREYAANVFISLVRV